MRRNKPTAAVLANIYKTIKDVVPGAVCYTPAEMGKMNHVNEKGEKK